MDAHALLTKWRHLVEPETSTGLTPVAWADVLQMPLQVFEAARSVVVTLDSDICGTVARSIWVAAGDLDEVLGLVREVEDSARRDGITRIVFMGRRGWVRAANGYREVATVGVKEV